GFMASTNAMMSRMERDTERFKKSVEQTIQDMKQENEKLGRRLDDTISEMKKDTEKMKQDTAKMKQDTEQMKKEMNKKWGDLANKMGTVVEDIVAPNIAGIAKKYFKIKKFDDFAIRYNRKNRVDDSKIKEFDIIAVSKDAFIINETKAAARESYVDEFVKFLNEEIYNYFPEHREKRLIPIFSCLYIPENIQNRLTKEKIYAMAMGSDTMDILNFKQIGQKSIDDKKRVNDKE
ncbi:MAG: hypothetical protein AB7U45_08160, partial [Desulfamplus sp.]